MLRQAKPYFKIIDKFPCLFVFQLYIKIKCIRPLTFHLTLFNLFNLFCILHNVYNPLFNDFLMYNFFIQNTVDWSKLEVILYTLFVLSCPTKLTGLYRTVSTCAALFRPVPCSSEFTLLTWTKTMWAAKECSLLWITTRIE